MSARSGPGVGSDANSRQHHDGAQADRHQGDADVGDLSSPIARVVPDDLGEGSETFRTSGDDGGVAKHDGGDHEPSEGQRDHHLPGRAQVPRKLAVLAPH